MAARYRQEPRGCRREVPRANVLMPMSERIRGLVAMNVAGLDWEVLVAWDYDAALIGENDRVHAISQPELVGEAGEVSLHRRL